MPQLRAVRFASLALVLLLSSSVVVRTASPQSSPQAGFRDRVDLVALDVRVSDKDGKPVPGLTADDFAVTLDGQSHAVKALDYQAFGKGSNGTPPGGAPARVLLLVVDDLSADPVQLKGLATSAQQMLTTLDDTDMVGVATTSGIGPSVPPTRDRAAITTALTSKDLAGRLNARPAKPFVGMSEAFDMVRTGGNKDVGSKVVERECSAGSSGGGSRSRTGSGGSGGGAKPDETCTASVVEMARAAATAGEQRTARQIAAFARAIDSLSAAAGPRTLVALSGGVALPLGASDALEILGRRASEAGVAFYGLVSIDEGDLTTEASSDRAKARRDENTFLTNGLTSMAQAAGGDAFRVVGTADRFFERIVGDTTSVYRLGVEAPTGGTPKRYVAVKISSKRPGLTLHASAQAARPSVPDASTPAADALKQRVEQGGTGFAVPIALTTSRRRDTSPTRVQLIASIDVPASTPAPVTAMFALINGSGAVVQSGKKDLPATPGDDYRLALPLPADAGDYRFRVAVADGKGHIGSLDDVLSVKLPKAGSVAVSDLVTTSAVGDAPPHLLAFETLPSHAQSLHVSLELYPDASAAAGLKVQLSVAPASGGAPIVNGEVPPVARDGRLLVSAALPVAALKPDRYVITATVLDGGKPIGTATAYVTKID